MMLRQRPGNSPGPGPDLFAAAKRGDGARLRLLLENGAAPDWKTGRGKTALMAASEKGHLQAAECLLEHRADPLERDRKGMSPLMFASFHGNEEVGRLLVPVSDINGRNDFGWTALMLASGSGAAMLARMLLERGAEPRLSDNNGRNALMKAVRGGKTGMVSVLAPLSEIDATDIDGDTALIKSARYGSLGICFILLENGADAGIRDLKGESALDKAIKHGFGDVAALLKKFL